MVKAYFVEMRMTAVVMAESAMDAMAEAEAEAWHICHDQDATAEDAVEIRSLEHLARLDNEWDGDCIPYGGDGATRLNELLPDEDAEATRDTKTMDMFTAPNAK